MFLSDLSESYTFVCIIRCLMHCLRAQLLLAKDLETVLALAKVCRETDRIPLATALLQIFRHERQEAQLLTTLADLDIENEGRRP